MSKCESTSPILFHGPTSSGRASSAADAWGRLIGVYGDPVEGLNTEIVREAASTMSSSPVGDLRGSIVVGPVDVLTQDGVMDILLKVLEEANPLSPQPFLWAYDIGSVRPTIQSRCLTEWCPGITPLSKQSMDLAKSVISSAVGGSMIGVLSSMTNGFSDLKKPRKGGGDEDDSEDGVKSVRWEDSGEDFLRAVALTLSRDKDIPHLLLWKQVRHLMLPKNPPPVTEVLAGFLPHE